MKVDEILHLQSHPEFKNNVCETRKPKAKIFNSFCRKFLKNRPVNHFWQKVLSSLGNISYSLAEIKFVYP